MPTQIETDRPDGLAAGGGRPVVWFTSTITLKASSPRIGVTEVLMSPGEEPPLHIHKNEDEWLYVLEGAMTFHVGGQNHPRKMEAFVSFPRRIRHTFSIETPQARFSHNEYARRFRADVRTGAQHARRGSPSSDRIRHGRSRAAPSASGYRGVGSYLRFLMITVAAPRVS